MPVCVCMHASMCMFIRVCSVSVAQWLEFQAANQEDLDSSTPAAISKVGQFRSPHFASGHSAV